MAYGWTILILIATLAPLNTTQELEIIPHFDKIIHFGLFMMHAVLLAPVLKSRNWIVITVIVGLCLGMLSEWLQNYVPGRETSILDLLADAGGTAIGLLIIYFVKKNE